MSADLPVESASRHVEHVPVRERRRAAIELDSNFVPGSAAGSRAATRRTLAALEYPHAVAPRWNAVLHTRPPEIGLVHAIPSKAAHDDGAGAPAKVKSSEILTTSRLQRSNSSEVRPARRLRTTGYCRFLQQ